MTVTSQFAHSSCEKWILDRLAFFDPRHPAKTDRMPYLKAFDELCLLALISTSGHDVRGVDKRLVDFCLNVTSSEAFLQIANDRLHSFQLFSIPAALEYRITGKSELRELLLSVVRDIDLLGRERLPHRTLDILYCVDALGFEDDIGTSNLKKLGLSAAYCSNLTHFPSLASANLADFYAFTHNVMFLSNFGRCEIVYDAFDSEKAVDFCILSTLRFCNERNFDLAAELLWCLRMLKARSAPATVYATAKMAVAISTDGYLASPAVKIPPGVLQQDLQTYRHYHSTLLGMALFSNDVMESEIEKLEGQSTSASIGELNRLGHAISMASRLPPRDRALALQSVAMFGISNNRPS